MATAFIACMLTLMLVYWAANRMVAQLGIWWAAGLLYAVLPITVTFILLHRSCWHRETAGVPRAFSVLLLSCAIFGGVMLAIGVVIVLALFFVVAVRICAGAR
ncbi:MAG TPA: hypothetical protein VFF11_09050 [Candidatus Binatia bacterium]|nr:hypothetical protein [Candidatus Binatia bacterium]